MALFRYGAFQYGAGPVRRISVWRSSGVAQVHYTAHFSMAQFRCGASKHRPKRAVPRVTCRNKRLAV